MISRGRSRSESGRWPVLSSYEGRHGARVAMPIGGIGTGTVSFWGWGGWRHWEIANRPAKRFTPTGRGRAGPFFALRAQAAGAAPVTRLLEGRLPDVEWEGAEGAPAPNAGLPRFQRSRFLAAYPLARLELRDSEVPLAAAVEVFNPLVPGDERASCLPVALVRVVLTNTGRQLVKASVVASLPNFIGALVARELAVDDACARLPARAFRAARGIERVVPHV
jgi:non-lysosomal glucosylceramidase